MKFNEYTLQCNIAEYLERQYPKVLFFSTGTSLKLTMPQAVRNQKLQKANFKIPDFVICEPGYTKGQFPGQRAALFIEFKRESPFKKDGNIKASQNDHLALQYEALIELRDRGYEAQFAWEFDQAKKLIDDYLRG